MRHRYLYGLHDREGRHIVPAGAWLVDTVEVRLEPNPRGTNYMALGPDINWIVRINHGYGSAGTIPTPDHYAEFARACAFYVASSRGADRFVIGNEPNHSQERPNGQPIQPADYIACYRLCYDAIKAARPDAQVIPAPVALWNLETGDWLSYWTELLDGCPADGIALHAYTHGPDPALITSSATMQPPYADRYWHFRHYLDLLASVPRDLPIYITECNQGGPWVDANMGWVRAAYAEIDGWNQNNPRQQIHCLCLYRWPRYDQWHIEGKPGVIADFQAAVEKGYTVDTGIGPAPDPTLPPIDRRWDSDLTRRGVRIVTPQLTQGQRLWAVTQGKWLDEHESGGRHHIYVDVLDETGKRVAGVPLLVRWPSGTATIVTEAKPGEPYAANYPMSPSRNEFSIQVMDGKPSETVTGIGMGADTPSGFNPGIHTSTALVFRRIVVSEPSDPPGPQPPSPPPDPPEPVPDTTWRGAVVASAGLNIRSGPGTEHAILTAAPEDAVLAVHTPIPGWLEVEYGGARGYAASRYLMLATGESAVSVPDDGPVEPVSEAMRTLWELWGNQIWDLAREYNVPLATLAAVVMAESGGRAFDEAGRLIVRFENHVFDDLWGRDHPETFARYFRYGDPPWTGHQWRPDDGPWRMCHVDNRQEHKTLIFARSLANEAALQATSMGLPQVLGMGHRAAGFTSAAEMFAAFQGDRSTHLPAMLHWIAKHGLIDELQRDDFYAFSVIYNGPGNAAVYSRIIESNVRQFERMFSEIPA